MFHEEGRWLWRELWVVVDEFKFKLHIQIQTSLGRHSLVTCHADVASWRSEVEWWCGDPMVHAPILLTWLSWNLEFVLDWTQLQDSNANALNYMTRMLMYLITWLNN